MRKWRVLTAATLEERGACTDQVALFRKHLGESVRVTVKRAESVADVFDFGWAACLLSGSALAEYKRVKAQAWAEYERVMAPAWAEYERVMAQAWAAAWAEYERVMAPAWAEYERVMAQALVEYKHVKAQAWAAAYISDRRE